MNDPPETDVIHCAFCTDDNYAQHLGVAIISLLENNRSSRFSIYIVHDGVSEANLAALSRVLESYPNVRGTFRHFESSPYSHFRVELTITLASYFRLFLTDLLPPDVKKVIYLDCDLIVLGDIAPLWRADLSDKLIAAAPDLFMHDNSRLGLPPDYLYFNSGVLVIDLEGWRSHNLQPLFINYAETAHDVLRFHDQDVLNVILKDKVKYLTLEWNYQPRFAELAPGTIGLTEPAFAELQGSPKIVHFTSHIKPWLYQFDVAFEDQYTRYLRKSPWRDFVPRDKNLKMVIRRHIKRNTPWVAGLLKSLGIRRRNVVR